MLSLALQLTEELETLGDRLANVTTEPSQSDQLEALQRTVVDMATRLSSDKVPPNSPGRRRRHVSETAYDMWYLLSDMSLLVFLERKRS